MHLQIAAKPSVLCSDVKSSRPDCPRGRNFVLVLGLVFLSSSSASASWFCPRPRPRPQEFGLDQHHWSYAATWQIHTRIWVEFPRRFAFCQIILVIVLLHALIRDKKNSKNLAAVRRLYSTWNCRFVSVLNIETNFLVQTFKRIFPSEGLSRTFFV